MNDKEQAAIQQALDALEEYRDTQMIKAPRRAITALREALDPELQFVRDWNEGKVRRVSDGKVMGVAEQAEQEPVGDGICLTAMQHPHNCCVLVDDVSEDSIEQVEQAEQEPSCNQHPDAPHGFARNASHNAGRYVCECEGWEPEQEPVAVVEITYGREPECYVTGNIDNFPEGVFKLYAAPVQQAEQEPMAWMVYTADGQSVYVTDNPTDIKDGQRALPLYAALVAAHEKKFWMEQIEVECNEAVLAERELCAKVCDELKAMYQEAGWDNRESGASQCAAAIRARGASELS